MLALYLLNNWSRIMTYITLLLTSKNLHPTCELEPWTSRLVDRQLTDGDTGRCPPTRIVVHIFSFIHCMFNNLVKYFSLTQFCVEITVYLGCVCMKLLSLYNLLPQSSQVLHFKLFCLYLNAWKGQPKYVI